MPTRSLTACLLAFLLACLACGRARDSRPDEATRAADDRALASLLPAEPALVLKFSSLDDALALQKALATLGFPLMSTDALLGGPATRRWRGEHMDTARAIVVVLRSPQDGEFGDPLLVLPMRDATRAAGPDGGLPAGYQLRAGERHVALSTDGPYEPAGEGAPPLALPEGPLALRLSPAALLEPLRGPLAAALTMGALSVPRQAGGHDPTAVMRASLQAMLEAADALPSVQLSLRLREGHLLLSGAATLAEDSLLARLPPPDTSSFDELLGWLDPDAMVVSLKAVDARAATGLAHPWLARLGATWGPAASDDVEQAIGLLRVLSAQTGHVFASMVGPRGPGHESASLFEATDPSRATARYADLYHLYLGLSGLGGADVLRHDGSFDGRPSIALEVPLHAILQSAVLPDPGLREAMTATMETIFGTDDVVRYVTTATDRHVLFTTGGRDEVARLAARIDRPASELPRALVEAAAAAREAGTCALWSIETTRVLSLALGMLRAAAGAQGEELPLPETIDGPPSRWTFWVGGTGTHWRLGADLDLGMLTALSGSLSGAPPRR